MKEETILKKSKKLLSLFLAALMLISCFGAISASAMTMDAAEAAAAEFNATIPDHSAVYANKSAKQWNNTMTGLDKTLSAILKQVDIKGKFYTDDTVNMLFINLGGMLYTELMELTSGMSGVQAMMVQGLVKQMSASKTGKELANNNVYPEIAAYLQTVEDYSEIDTSKLVWGVTPGNREQFVEAASWALQWNVGTALSLLTGLLASGSYEALLVPILEAFHQDKMPDFYTYGHAPKGQTLAPILNILCGAVEELEVAPIAYICEILPDVTKSVGEGLAFLKTGPGLMGKLGIDLSTLPGGLADIIPMIVPMIPSLLGLGEDYVMPALNLPEIDENYLITMGKAVAVESGLPDGYRMAIEGNSTMVFAAVAQYVQEVLQDKNNQAAIGDLIVAKVGPDYLENYREIVDAALNGTPIDVADACLSFVEDYADSIIEQEDVNPVAAFFAKIVKFFSDLAKKIIALFK